MHIDFIACENNSTKHTYKDDDANGHNSTEHVEQNSHGQISLQLETNPNTNTMLEVDTISSAKCAEEQKK